MSYGSESRIGDTYFYESSLMSQPEKRLALLYQRILKIFTFALWCNSSQLYPTASPVPSGGGAKCLQQQRTSKRNKIEQKCPKITALSCTDAHPQPDLSFRAPNRYRNDASWSKALFFCFPPVFLNRPTPNPLFFHLTGTKTYHPYL